MVSYLLSSYFMYNLKKKKKTLTLKYYIQEIAINL